ncbi:kinase-like domain-containing protein [Mycena filopes]|nr:kinase-like domain-containing protein [Mycena filopes]
MSHSTPSLGALGNVAMSLGKSVGEMAGDWAPIPGLGPATAILFSIIQLCQNITSNRKAATQLGDRCHQLALVLSNKFVAKENVEAAIASLAGCLKIIETKMVAWAALGKIKAFVQQDVISLDIKNCHEMLSDSLATFQLVSHIEVHDWQSQFQTNAQADVLELKAHLSSIENTQDIIIATMKSHHSEIQGFMSMVQQLLGGGSTDRAHNGLASLLYGLQITTGEPLPDFHLRRGEVFRTGTFPISGTGTMDIYEGLYLGRKKVAIKVLRTVNLNDDDSLREKSLRASDFPRLFTRTLTLRSVLTLRCQRFMRECDIWKEVWRVDQGKHILPFYGFCQLDVPFPFMISPFMSNGSAITYVKTSLRRGNKIDYLSLVKGIALGIQVLHNMNPPIVHGDIKASNVVIDETGNPLLADFGLSRIMEDITGAPFSQSRNVSDSYRWFAPELCSGAVVLSPSSDIYSFAMCTLELFTHQPPFSNIQHNSEVVILTAQESNPNNRPPRPTSEEVRERGLNDDIWALLCHCWAHQRLQRPTIQEVLSIFPQ